MRTSKPDRPSLELDDYSGPFQPDLHVSDFSKEGLMKLPPRASTGEPHCRWRIAMADERVDYAADPGAYVKAHGLERSTDAEIVNDEAGKYSKKGS